MNGPRNHARIARSRLRVLLAGILLAGALALFGLRVALTGLAAAVAEQVVTPASVLVAGCATGGCLAALVALASVGWEAGRLLLGPARPGNRRLRWSARVVAAVIGLGAPGAAHAAPAAPATTSVAVGASAGASAGVLPAGVPAAVLPAQVVAGAAGASVGVLPAGAPAAVTPAEGLAAVMPAQGPAAAAATARASSPAAAPQSPGAAQSTRSGPDPRWNPGGEGGAASADLRLVGASRTADPDGGEVVVRRGECLWDIAARHLGPEASPTEIAREWPRWYAANRARIGADPDLIRPGLVLRVPS